jgi:hypothetical protein
LSSSVLPAESEASSDDVVVIDYKPKQPTSKPPSGRAVALSKWAVRLCMAFSLWLSFEFIRRTAFTIFGERTYTLFDDAMISMRYARNLAEGNGLVWNSGERIEGYTNLLWTLWMALLHVLPFPDRLTPALVAASGAALLAVGVWLSAVLARELAPRSAVAPVIAAALTATSYPLMFWTLRGMEVGLLAVIATGSVILALRARNASNKRAVKGLCALLVAGLLTRPDAVIIALVVVPFAFLMRERGERKALIAPLIGAPIAVLGALTAFRLAYYGAPVPNTYTLKVEGIPLDFRIKRGGKAMLELFFKGGMLMLVVAAAIAPLAALRKRGASGRVNLFSPAMLAASMCAAFMVYSVYVGGDAWEDLKIANRYVSTILPILFALVAAGLVTAVRRSLAATSALVAAVAATVLLANVKLPTLDALYQPRTDMSDSLFGSAVVAVVVLAAAALLWRRRRSSTSAIAALAVAGCFAVATSGTAMHFFWENYIPLEPGDRDGARYGTVLQDMTEPGTRIALSSAGNIAYFAGDDRVFVDELGKMDTHIAHEAPRRPDFPPGHQKWNYDYSFHVLQPDLISQSFGLVPEDVRKLQDAGWVQVNNDAFVRPGANNVDATAIRQFHENWRMGIHPN